MEIWLIFAMLIGGIILLIYLSENEKLRNNPSSHLNEMGLIVLCFVLLFMPSLALGYKLGRLPEPITLETEHTAVDSVIVINSSDTTKTFKFIIK